MQHQLTTTTNRSDNGYEDEKKECSSKDEGSNMDEHNNSNQKNDKEDKDNDDSIPDIWYKEFESSFYPCWSSHGYVDVKQLQKLVQEGYNDIDTMTPQAKTTNNNNKNIKNKNRYIIVILQLNYIIFII